MDHKSFSYLILSMTISSCLLFFLLLCMRALSPFSPFVRLTCPVRWYQLVPHKPFGTLLAGVSATGSNDPAGSTGTRPTFVLYMLVNSCRMSIHINKHTGGKGTCTTCRVVDPVALTPARRVPKGLWGTSWYLMTGQI